MIDHSHIGLSLPGHSVEIELKMESTLLISEAKSPHSTIPFTPGESSMSTTVR